MSPNMEFLLTPRFFEAANSTPWPPTPTKATRYISLPVSNVGPFKSSWNDFVESNRHPVSPIGSINPNSPTLEQSRPPDIVYVHDDWDDAVSVLYDDPDEDDAQLLPHSTYDVLAPLLHEMYMDDNE